MLLKQQFGVQNKTQVFGSTVGVKAPSSAMFIFDVCNYQIGFVSTKIKYYSALAQLSPSITSPDR